tara:strand:- start:79 stop:366 length:288 start_codon:yes stop_codon:yes gene_type:complete
VLVGVANNLFKCISMKLIQKIKKVFITKNTNIMKRGTVKFFNNSKGFGFIQEEGSNEDIFVHLSGLIDDIRENDEVTFETAQGKKGINAVNVQLA